ncbi:MAG: SDR family oxidoreductase [Bacteroidales bacterium]|jgi:UDP-N-acetylglucosamine 4-epimerase|nr:SDR family oxidoreductase [Bacteroidales bacterium]
MAKKEYITNKKVLVTGGAGFIGSNLCENLLQNGNTVVCLDNFSTGKEENIRSLKENPNFVLIEGDIRNLDTCHRAVKDADVVMHQAALGSVPRSINDPITSNDVNVSGFLNVLVATRDAKIKRFVYACSSSTYGDSEELPKVEEKIGKPLSPYAVTKYVNELYADVFAKLYGIETIGLRYFNVYGRRQDPFSTYSAVIPIFVSKIINGQAITINGDGGFSRDFTHVDNVVLANNLAATTSSQGAINQIYNVACGEQTSLNELAQTLIENLSQFDKNFENSKIIYGPQRAGDVPHSKASIEKIRSFLKYEPILRFKEGVAEACRWYWENIK